MRSEYTFLPWVRQGIAGAIVRDNLNDPPKSRAEMAVTVTVKGQAKEVTLDPIKIKLYGPGDITGFDHRQILRTDPKPYTSGFEPNYFPFIEFDRPDFPWMFTPTAANGDQQLRPWICLVVVEKAEGNLEINPNRPLPFLKAIPQTELPDLGESRAWAHVQVTGDPFGLDNMLNTKPDLTVSRLLCPRRLREKTSYYACVVPAFEIGRKAGLGLEVKDGEDELLQPAWKDEPHEIDIPVYYHWEFSTGAAGDFESLVWLLQRRQLSRQEVGTRDVIVKNPDPDNTWPETPKIPLEGALRAYQVPYSKDPGPLELLQDDKEYQKFQNRLQGLLNKTKGATLPTNLPMAPPIYGRWHAAQKIIPDGKRDAKWLRDLNLNPSHRIVAGIGTHIVQDQQEHLMASAWEQVGEIEKANQILRQAQLARAAGTTIYEKHLKALPDEIFFMITGQVHSRTFPESGKGKTIFAITGESRIPQAMAQGAFRRFIRPRGPIARRLKLYGGIQPGRLLQKLNNAEIDIVPKRLPPRGMVTMDRVMGTLERMDRFCAVTPEELFKRLQFPAAEDMINSLSLILSRLDQLLTSDLPTEAQGQLISAQQSFNSCLDLFQSGSSPSSQNILKKVMASLAAGHAGLTNAMRIFAKSNLSSFAIVDELHSTLNGIIPLQKIHRFLFMLTAMAHQRDMEPCEPPSQQPKAPLKFRDMKSALLEQLNPAKTIVARLKSRIIAPVYWKPDDELEPILAAPEFPMPMYKPLSELSQDLLLPGLENVPPNTISLLETNPRFIEAYMVGLNHEMSRELLWREFPTDQRGTYFRQFWDLNGKVPRPTTDEQHEALKDIKPIHEWEQNKELGGNLIGASAESQTVLLIRGELLRCYPNAVVYAAKAEWVETKDSNGKVVWRRAPEALKVDSENIPINEEYPIFQGTLSPDITFLGFNLDPKATIGADSPNKKEPGWFFVLQQPPTEPRYGLDETVADTVTGTWRDLSWVHVNLTRPGDGDSSDEGYIKLEQGLKNTFPGITDQKELDRMLVWSEKTDSAQIAAITLQSPVRVAIHASDLLPVEEK